MNDSILRDRIAAVLMRDAFGLTTQTAALRQADAVIAALDRDYIIVAPGTALAQKIVEWQLENSE